MPVNKHILVVGGLTILLGIVALVLRRPHPQLVQLDVQSQALRVLLGLVSYALAIPMMLLGASWSDEDQTP